ncbi:MAG: hypothetical protein EBZ74_12630 [Planctomycetia bacterium]|nr:hypothetical protein [Planctomycetia bacterium]
MDIAGVRGALHSQPFVPFTIRLADGRALPVPHPDFVALTPRRVIVGAADDTWSVLEPLLIVSLDHAAGRLDDGSDAGDNGRRAG